MRVLTAALHPEATGAQNRTMQRNFGVPVPQVDVLDKSLQFLVGAERQAGTRMRHRREVQFADMPNTRAPSARAFASSLSARCEVLQGRVRGLL